MSGCMSSPRRVALGTEDSIRGMEEVDELNTLAIMDSDEGKEEEEEGEDEEEEGEDMAGDTMAEDRVSPG